MNPIRRLFSRGRRRAALAQDDRGVDDATREVLTEFIQQHRGVEGWVESATQFNKPSLVLIAYDGEWLRRSVPSSPWAFDFCSDMEMPVYQAGVVPYPQRKRDWDAAHRRR